MRIEPQYSGVSIVLVGSLNPRIFTPDWFGKFELLSPTELKTTKIEIIHSQISQFTTDRLVLQAEQERIIFTITHAPFIWLRDLVVRTFKEFLPHSPVGKLGINREVHYAVENAEKRNRVGHTLAPPEAWGEWEQSLKSISRSSGLSYLMVRYSS